MASKHKRKVGTDGIGKEKVSSSSMDVQHFLEDHNPEELEWYQKFYQKKIVQTPKFGDLSSFPEECFNFQDKLISLGGKKITLTPKRLGQILDIPSGGHMLYDPDDEVWNDYNKREFYFGSSLILHHLMTHTIKLKSLPYAWFITCIMEYFNVDFSDVEYCLMDTRSHKISIKNVDKRMGYWYNPETNSVMFIGGNNEKNEEVPQEGNGGEDVPPQNVPPSSGLSNQDLFNFMTSQFSNLNTCFNDQWISENHQITLNHEATTNRINLLQTDMNQHFSYLYSHLNIALYDPNNPTAPAPIFTPIQQQFPHQGNNYTNTNNDMKQP
ncbi:hypothetical protein KIW84_062777 [Lathyrus oleraceus]|uniref:Uncharacterized protein n=1 Tax=Pisum sativum TaxID=3888 RepID=A0A9D4W795_PEA|nr:hypothetical protein KIW84_062777 [Pisum sativum]